jgi:dTDP-4-amino-4,6-dideoxygalactose transaminase
VTSSVPFIDLAAIHAPMIHELHDALDRVVAASTFIDGEHVESFEQSLAERIGTRHAVAVASGTAALHLALAAAGVGRGDEVIIPANTFFATAEAVVATGAVPVLADVDARTALLDPESAAAAIGPRTAALVPVHLYGQPVDAAAFRDLAERKGLLLLEDACQAIGARWNGRPVGSFGDAAAFSFYPGKNLGALGDGGAVTTDDDVLARRIRLLRSHGEAAKHEHRCYGSCERMGGLQAAFLDVKLRHLDAHQRQRDALAHRYEAMLAEVPQVGLLELAPAARHVHHLQVVLVPERDAVLTWLLDRAIGAAVHYPTPIHLQAGAPGLGAAGAFPVVEHLCAHVLSLPLWPGMPETAVETVVGELGAAIGGVAVKEAV